MNTRTLEKNRNWERAEYMGFDPEPVIGKAFSSYEIDRYDEPEKFKLVEEDGDEMVWQITAGCCSDSYISNVEINGEFYGEKITDVKFYELPERLLGTRQEVDRLYSVEFITDKMSVMQIEFRNSSNGYYGGDMEYVEAK